jgi:ferredoxin
MKDEAAPQAITLSFCHQSMSIEVTFEEDGGSGLVAVGASLWEAAKRLGVGLRADCKGLGECEGCALQIIQGADSLSPAAEAELKVLGAERLLAGQRLACQAILIKTVAVVARVVPPADNDGQKQQSEKALPLKQQIGAFIETEANAISQAVNMIRGKSNELVEKFLNLQPKEPDSTSQSGNGGPSEETDKGR